jgi:hypothetical protein
MDRGRDAAPPSVEARSAAFDGYALRDLAGHRKKARVGASSGGRTGLRSTLAPCCTRQLAHVTLSSGCLSRAVSLNRSMRWPGAVTGDGWPAVSTLEGWPCCPALDYPRTHSGYPA